MDEASEGRDTPAMPPPLQYATGTEAADALRVYRLVGMGFGLTQ